MFISAIASDSRSFSRSLSFAISAGSFSVLTNLNRTAEKMTNLVIAVSPFKWHQYLPTIAKTSGGDFAASMIVMAVAEPMK